MPPVGSQQKQVVSRAQDLPQLCGGYGTLSAMSRDRLPRAGAGKGRQAAQTGANGEGLLLCTWGKVSKLSLLGGKTPSSTPSPPLQWPVGFPPPGPWSETALRGIRLPSSLHPQCRRMSHSFLLGRNEPTKCLLTTDSVPRNAIFRALPRAQCQ